MITSISDLHCPCGGDYGGVAASEARYRIVRCASCGLLATDPRTSDDADYEGTYFEKNYLDRLDHWRRAHAHWFRKIVVPLAPAGRKPRVLDVGCGIGLFLSVVDPSWDRHGVEPSARACEIACRKFGLTPHCMMLEDLQVGEGFDVITFWDVLEHLPDPIATLRVAQRHLRPGGRLVLKVPDIDTGALALGKTLARFGKGSVIFHIGAHLYQFDERSLRRTLSTARLRVDSLKSYQAPEGLQAFFMKGRLRGRLARLAIHLGGLDRSLIAVTRAS